MKFSVAATAVIGVASAGAISRADPVDCTPTKNSTAPEPSPNTYDAFQDFALYRQMSSAASVPAGYKVEFVNFVAAINSPAYIAFFDLDSYSPAACADLCEQTVNCGSFNVYFQRNPSLTPGAACPNPKANVLARCGLYSGSIYEDQATNIGESRGPPDSKGETFRVAMRGSNAYNKLSASTGTAFTTSTSTETTTSTSTVTVFPTGTATITSTSTTTTTSTSTTTNFPTSTATIPPTSTTNTTSTSTTTMTFTNTSTMIFTDTTTMTFTSTMTSAPADTTTMVITVFDTVTTPCSTTPAAFTEMSLVTSTVTVSCTDMPAATN